MCAIAMLENIGGESSVRREVRYIQGAQKALDEAHGWGHLLERRRQMRSTVLDHPITSNPWFTAWDGPVRRR